MDSKRVDAGIITLSQAAETAGRTTEALRQAIDAGKLSATYFPPGRPFMGNGIWMTTKKDLADFLATRRKLGIIESKE